MVNEAEASHIRVKGIVGQQLSFLEMALLLLRVRKKLDTILCVR